MCKYLPKKKKSKRKLAITLQCINQEIINDDSKWFTQVELGWPASGVSWVRWAHSTNKLGISTKNKQTNKLDMGWSQPESSRHDLFSDPLLISSIICWNNFFWINKNHEISRYLLSLEIYNMVYDIFFIPMVHGMRDIQPHECWNHVFYMHLLGWEISRQCSIQIMKGDLWFQEIFDYQGCPNN